MRSLPHGNIVRSHIVHLLLPRLLEERSTRRKHLRLNLSQTLLPRNSLKSERTYMSVDTSTRKKKDEPDTGFGEEDEMVNEEEEETFYHGTQLDYADISTHGLEGEVGRTPTHIEPSPDVGEHHKKTVTPIVRPQRKRGVAWYQQTPFTVMQSTPKLKKIIKTRKKKAVKSPEKANEDIVNEERNDVSNHLLLDSLHATSTLSFWKEWNMISSKLNTKHRLHILPLDVEFWSMNVADGVGGYPKWKDVDMVLFPINVLGVHWFLAVLHLNIWKVHIYDSTRSMNFFSKYLMGGEFTSFNDSIISELDVIDYWNDFPDGHKAKATIQFVDTVDAPHQEYIEDRGDCGVFVRMFMEMIVLGVQVKIDKPHRDAVFLYRNRMKNIIWDTL
ncbi:unnamed protein product [Lactuca virosa]|uniref:Ubiquitin-like protease family profile domain-containing protein n=1 Tax=Lactuca virosa TaxID=75947 RepID=A0AAU9PVK8_9ASTR|nr:unnamed protein product [Lactuca virosa]